jgi:uncharacterized protein YbjT (DUF2867 family)
MRIVVTGGLGDLGARVVRQLSERGHEAVAASRRTGVDLSSGTGLDTALAGADAVVHCASSSWRPKAVDVLGTRRLTAALSRQDEPAHLVHISIVGCDLVAFGYYRAKVEAEGAIERSSGPATIVRATQFHSLAAFMARMLGFGPVGVTVGDLRLAPVDIDWVASRLADHAESPPPAGVRRSAELGGPADLSVPELAAAVAAHDARRPGRFLRFPPVGPLRAVSAGALLPSGTAERGGRTFGEWLANQPHPLPRGRHDRT